MIFIKANVPEGNKAEVKGKLTKLGKVKYLPSGLAVLEGTLAIVQNLFGKKSIGYLDFILSGNLAEDIGRALKVGASVSCSGSLICRKYKDLTGRLVSEQKLLIESLSTKL